MQAIHLGVNIDHVATLRQVRRAAYPDPLLAALIAEQSGADSARPSLAYTPDAAFVFTLIILVNASSSDHLLLLHVGNSSTVVPQPVYGGDQGRIEPVLGLARGSLLPCVCALRGSMARG